MFGSWVTASIVGSGNKVMYNMTYMQMAVHPRIVRRKELFELSDAQEGYFTAAQARKLGYLKQYQQHHRKTGAWLAVGRGLFRLRDYPPGEHEQLVQLSLWSHNRQGQPQAVVSHQSALAFYELSEVLPGKVHLTVPPGFRKSPLPGVVLHKARLDVGDIQSFAGFRVTKPLRTLVDVALAHLSLEHLELAAWQALERGLVRRKTLQEVLSNKEWLLSEGALEVFARVLEEA